jgi:hypothetical protein
VLAVVVWPVEVVVVVVLCSLSPEEVLDELLVVVVEMLEVRVVKGSVTWIALGTLTAVGDAVFPEAKMRSPT